MTGTIEIRPLTGAIGAEIVGVDLSGEISNQQFDAIHQAWLDYLVIYFRNQNLTPQQHRDFAARFSALEAHPYVESIEEVPEIIAIVKEPDEHRNWGGPLACRCHLQAQAFKRSRTLCARGSRVRRGYRLCQPVPGL